MIFAVFFTFIVSFITGKLLLILVIYDIYATYSFSALRDILIRINTM